MLPQNKTTILLVGAVVALFAGTAAAQSTDPSAPMTREKFLEYVRLFNADDPHQFDYYTSDVQVEADKVHSVADLKAHDESTRRDAAITFSPGLIAIDDSKDMMAVEMTILTVALRDGVNLGGQPQPIHKGDARTQHSTFFFALRDGKISALIMGGGARVRQKVDLAAAQAEAPTAAELAEPMPASVDDPKMTRQKYEDYARLFSRFDPRFLKFYDPGVVFATLPAPKPIHGPKAIYDLYVPFRKNLDEHVTAPVVVIDNAHNVMVVQLHNRMVATRGDVKLPSGVLKRGEALITSGVIVYSLKNGKISYIRAGQSGSSFQPAAH
jgi:hypothetical protein